MGKIIIIGAGAMGTAFGYPCSDNKHEVNIIGTHLENKTIEELNKTVPLGRIAEPEDIVDVILFLLRRLFCNF